jgi:dipeptidyl aminopeptidase/acylaminoacyl peptidase
VPKRVSDSNPWLGERRLAAQEIVRFEARDGMDLEGLLIRPLEPEAGERVPLVLVVHGGPEAHFANGWLTVYSRPGQVLAARGLAVFYPNYRGSTGRGLEFAKTSQADPAGKEFDDLIDAVDHLIAIGLVDKDRVGVTGGSYGGYATAWSSTRYSERFAAGVMFVGISEKVAKLGTSDIPVELYSVHARRWPWENWQLHLERSPVYWVEKARTPLLILGGDADTRVHPSQSLVLYRYLKILGNAPVRYVIYPGERHGNRKAAARLDYSLRSVRWLEHYLMGPGGEPPAHEVDYGLDTESAGGEMAEE